MNKTKKINVTWWVETYDKYKKKTKIRAIKTFYIKKIDESLDMIPYFLGRQEELVMVLKKE